MTYWFVNKVTFSGKPAMARANQEFYSLLCSLWRADKWWGNHVVIWCTWSKNLSLLFWKYDRFSLNNMENDERISEFRFEKEDLFLLHSVLQIPDRITCYNNCFFWHWSFVYKIYLFVSISGRDIKVWKTNVRAMHNKLLRSELYLRPIELLTY